VRLLKEGDVGDRERFLEALAADPLDDATRLVYSDWLEENGEPEEAGRMRRWRASYEWMCRLAHKAGGTLVKYGDQEVGEQDDWREFDVEEIIQAGTDYAAGEDYLCQYGSQTLRDAFYYDQDGLASRAPVFSARDYWAHWETLTGGRRPGPEEHRPEPPPPFTCSC
jgi:uncharacterized protein (TIGR02996 family)